jgi:hypothetical protein
MRFDNFLSEEDDIKIILEHMILMEEIDSLNESTELSEDNIVDKVNSVLGKLGLHAHSSKKGLLHMLKAAGANVSQLIWHAIKAAKGDMESKQKVKELANKEVKKEDVMDFFIKLDTLSMHLLSGPIHMIDALTGWHIAPKLEKTAKDIEYRVDRALTHLTKIKDEVAKPLAKKISQYISGLKKTFKTEGNK